MPFLPEPDDSIERLEVASGEALRIIRWESPQPTADVPWLLVHGLASNARLWDGVGAALAGAGCTAVAVDQRGHGRSSKPDHGYDMASVADDLAQLLDALGWATVNVAGQSWGGNVAVELAHRHADRVETLVGVDGGAIELAAQWPEWDDCAAALAPPPLIGRPIQAIEDWLADMAADWPDEGRAATMANFEIRDDHTIAPWLTFDRHMSVLRGLWEHDPRDRLSDITTPTLFIGCGADEAKRRRVETMAQLVPRSAVEWFPDAHHDVHAQHPGLVADLLLAAASSQHPHPLFD